MGVEPFLIAYSVNIVVAQRLIRKLCPRCKIKVKEIDFPVLKKFGLTDGEMHEVYRPVGCIDCLKGYKGRVAIHEALYFTKEIRQLVLDAGDSINEEELRQAGIRNGMITL
ncbi:MAG TPA: pilus assembly protein PilB, partial [Bacteroidetes bacterium]|nr:pilus assembly protein PilB [Bacteroidota bacterium]